MNAELDVETARWLVSPSGLDAVVRATRDLDDGHRELDLVARFRHDGLPARATAAAVTAAGARRRARSRWPDADKLLFTRGALEQASDPDIARWRAARFAGTDVWDLCAGVGGDALELGVRAHELTAVEADAGRAVLLGHNAGVRGLDVDVVVADALTVDIPASAVVHVDPGRRRDGKRVKWLREHVPSVPALLERFGTMPGLGVVLSPAVDLADPDLPSDIEVEFLQLGDRLVESALWAGCLRRGSAVATATLLPDGPERSRSGPRPPRLRVGEVGDHLIEVASAAVRARLHDDIGREIGARRLATHRALLTSNGRPPASPWFRSRPILTVLPARPKAVKAWLRRTDPGPLELVLHGLDGDPDRWWRELGRPPRGPSGVRIELVRLDEGARAIVTQAVPGLGGGGAAGGQRAEPSPGGARRGGSGCAGSGPADR